MLMSSNRMNSFTPEKGGSSTVDSNSGGSVQSEVPVYKLQPHDAELVRQFPHLGPEFQRIIQGWHQSEGNPALQQRYKREMERLRITYGRFQTSLDGSRAYHGGQSWSGIVIELSDGSMTGKTETPDHIAKRNSTNLRRLGDNATIIKYRHRAAVTYTYNGEPLTENGRLVSDYRNFTYEMARVELKHLGITVYTIDGNSFHTDPEALIRGERLSVKDETRLISGQNNDGTWTTGNLSVLQGMNDRQGKRKLQGWGNFAVSLVSDVALIFSWAAKAAKAGAKTITITSNANRGSSAVSYSWSLANAVRDISRGDANVIDRLIREVFGNLPIIGTGISFVDAMAAHGYTVKFE
jgi:hypothetical protein